MQLSIPGGYIDEEISGFDCRIRVVLDSGGDVVEQDDFFREKVDPRRVLVVDDIWGARRRFWREVRRAFGGRRWRIWNWR
jgi:hypothetical protein